MTFNVTVFCALFIAFVLNFVGVYGQEYYSLGFHGRFSVTKLNFV